MLNKDRKLQAVQGEPPSTLTVRRSSENTALVRFMMVPIW